MRVVLESGSVLAINDILPASDSGAYFAGGVLVGSTLARNATLVTTPTAPLAVVQTASLAKATCSP
jgi:hypothetical protein